MRNTQNKSVGETKKKARLILFFLKGCKRLFLMTILMAGLSALANMLTPQIIRATIDNAIGGAEPEFAPWIMKIVDGVGGFAYLGEHLWIMAAAVMAVALLLVLSQYFFRVFNTKAAETLVKNMRDTLFNHIERLPFAWHMKNQTGDIIQRCTSDIDTTKNFVSEQLTSIFRIVGLLILSIAFMVSMNPLLTLIAVLPLPAVFWYSKRFNKVMGKGFMECDENEGKLSAIAQENLTGVRVVRAFGRERYEKDRFQNHNEYYTGLWVRMAKLMSRFWSVSDILSGIQVMLVVVMGAVFCVRGRMLSGEYIAFISYNAQLVWPIRMLGRTISEMSKAGVSIDRIRYIMESEEETDRPGATEPDMRGDICFEHVSFAYDGCPEMIHDVSLTIPAGSTLGILGSTGSGKSTLMYLLDRLYELPENGGRITVGGVDIRDIRAEHLRRNIGIVLQEPFLFSRTLGENIAITRDGIPVDEVKDAAKTACLDETIESFAKGYDTFVGERGVTLSGGQKQRAAIARMLIQKTPIMILDDSLSAVDTETDAKIRSALEARFGSATIILISHRITTLSKADQVIVMENGRITERGTPEELRTSGGIYRKIYDIQSDSGEEA